MPLTTGARLGHYEVIALIGSGGMDEVYRARVFARGNQPDACLDMLDRIIERGFYCSSIMLRDPWLDPIRGQARFSAIVSRADARSREAQAEFVRLNGDRILGLNAS